jgi:biotin carboxyl carrier protein
MADNRTKRAAAVKLDLIIDGREERIEISTGCFRIGAGPLREVSVEAPQPGVYSVLLDGRSYQARVEQGVVTVNGFRYEIEVRDPRGWSRQSAAGAGAGAQSVKAPMPGKVVRVLVTAGDAVEAGQGIVVVEAMKMQNELKAPRAGKVTGIAAKVGATVTAGEVLATIEFG